MDVAPVVHAQPAEPPVENAISVGYAVVDYESAEYVFDYGTVGVADHLWLAPGIELGAGARVGFGASLEHGYAGEVFGSIALVPHFRTLRDETGLTGSWRPAAGIEIGYSSAKVEFTVTPLESISRRDTQAGPVYLEFLARPARFRLSGFDVTALGIGVGAPFADQGRKVRVQIDVLHVGIVL